jgi:hypothetical protein
MPGVYGTSAPPAGSRPVLNHRPHRTDAFGGIDLRAALRRRFGPEREAIVRAARHGAEQRPSHNPAPFVAPVAVAQDALVELAGGQAR